MKFFRFHAVIAILLALSTPAFAHTTIVASNIENGAEMTQAPDVFEFSFGASVGLAGLELETLEGAPIDIDFERPAQMAKDFSVSLPQLDIGTYIMKWRAVAKDGHVMRGEINFTIVE